MFLERPQIDNIAADTFGAASNRRGIEVRYQKADAFLPGDNLVINLALTGAQTASANGHGTGGDEQVQLLDRVSYRFWSDGPSNASIGFSNANILNSGTPAANTVINLQDRPQIRVDGTRLITTGNIVAQTGTMWAFDGGINIENFFVGGEWAQFQVDRKANGAMAADTPSFSGWYVEGSWILTGETKSYTVTSTNNEVGGFGAPKVANPFSLSGDSWGAWELAARYSNTDLNWNPTRAATSAIQAGINGGEERDILVGLNWYLNNNVKFQTNVIFTSIDKFSGVAHTAANNASQDYTTIGIRLQFTN
jgi:phosphate-selective porin OprO/OprP